MRRARGDLWSTERDHLTEHALFTVGHSTRSAAELERLLTEQGVQLLVDVRTAPGSRRHPQFAGDALERSLAERKIGYVHERGLGGFRKPHPDSPNTGWEHPAFRGYADYMASTEFADALGRLEGLAGERPTVIMCAEAQWWRCHRRLIADALTVGRWRVLHLGLKAEPVEHQLTPFAVVDPDGKVTYPSPQQQLMP